MKNILIIVASYWPGFKGFGILQSVVNLVDVFGDKANFRILTHNHDLNSNEVYRNVITDAWNKVGKADVFYSSKNSFSFGFLKAMTKGYDSVFLCGPYWLFSQKVVLLKKLGLLQPKIYMAPMGSLSPGALKLKRLKKYLFWKLFNFLGLGAPLVWSFSSELEKNDAQRVLHGKNVSEYILAMDLPRRYCDYRALRNGQAKNPGELRILFLSRISKEKNLSYALDLLKNLAGKITFDIYGNVCDENYWSECLFKMKSLPGNITCHYKGAITPNKVVQTFSAYDCFLLPTFGENFGHVIYESLLAGCIPVISDTTPWNEIAHLGCGYVTALDKPRDYAEKIQILVSLEEKEISKIRKIAYLHAEYVYENLVKNSGYSQLL